MTKISELIGLAESRTVEWKSSLSETKEIIQSVCAFSNTFGGRVVVGVDDAGVVCGVEIGRSTLEKLSNQIAQSTDPSIIPDIAAHNVGGKTILVIEVKESPDHLTLAMGRPYKRTGKSTVRIGKAEYERLIIEKHKEILRFDAGICAEARPSDIDQKSVHRFLLNARRERALDIDGALPIMEALERMKLARSDRLTNAAVLLFGKDPQKFFLQAVVKAIRFKGATVADDMLDFKCLKAIFLASLNAPKILYLNIFPFGHGLKKAGWNARKNGSIRPKPFAKRLPMLWPIVIVG